MMKRLRPEAKAMTMCMRTGLRSWLALMGLLMMLAPAAALEDRVPAAPDSVRQKADYVEHLVTDSASVTRIEQEGNAEASETLARARALVVEARSELNADLFESANAKLDEALALILAEVQRLSGEEVRTAHEGEIYERRLKAVRAFLGAYERVAGEGTGDPTATQMGMLERLIGAAEEQAAGQRYRQAIATLDQAYHLARNDIREVREGQTLVRSLDFATAAEAYEYELGRNESHFMLLQYAKLENNPAGSVVGRIDQNHSEAEKLRAEAEREAAGGGHAAAIGLLNQSTDLLLKAIRMSGVFVPG